MKSKSEQCKGRAARAKGTEGDRESRQRANERRARTTTPCACPSHAVGGAERRDGRHLRDPRAKSDPRTMNRICRPRPAKKGPLSALCGPSRRMPAASGRGDGGTDRLDPASTLNRPPGSGTRRRPAPAHKIPAPDAGARRAVAGGPPRE